MTISPSVQRKVFQVSLFLTQIFLRIQSCIFKYLTFPSPTTYETPSKTTKRRCTPLLQSLPNCHSRSWQSPRGCPVLEGEKWSATKWSHVDSFDKIVASPGGDCADENDNCERWAALGECTNNREYMVGTPEGPGYCRRSCQSC